MTDWIWGGGSAGHGGEVKAGARVSLLVERGVFIEKERIEERDELAWRHVTSGNLCSIFSEGNWMFGSRAASDKPQPMGQPPGFVNKILWAHSPACSSTTGHWLHVHDNE